MVIRPEDVWLTILIQFSFYVNAHAEELRDSFVAHEDKKELEIVFHSGNRFTVDQSLFARRMTELMHDNIVDSELRTWILPSFSTTTLNDITVASIIMMGTLKAYFDYKETITCGIPSVQLLGEKSDYEDIFRRLDKLSDYGEEPTRFAAVLKPVLWHIVESFDDPQGTRAKDFWTRILKWNSSQLSGGDYWTGWAISFLFWDADGKRLALFPGDQGWESKYDYPPEPDNESPNIENDDSLDTCR